MKLTKRQLEQLLDLAGIKKQGAQAYYYGRNNVINRNLADKGLIARGINGWEVTPQGFDYIQPK